MAFQCSDISLHRHRHKRQLVLRDEGATRLIFAIVAHVSLVKALPWLMQVADSSRYAEVWSELLGQTVIIISSYDHQQRQFAGRLAGLAEPHKQGQQTEPCPSVPPAGHADADSSCRML